MSEKDKIFSRSGKSQEILKKCQKFWPFDPYQGIVGGDFVLSCQGIVREFCHDIIFRLKLPSYDKGSTWVALM